MSGTYLVCDLCGNYGPPAGFLFKDGVRLCYVCYSAEAKNVTKPINESVDSTPVDENRLAPPMGKRESR